MSDKSIHIEGLPAAIVVLTAGTLMVIGGIRVFRNGMKFMK